MPDFTYAGCKEEIKNRMITFNVKDYGIMPDTNEDLTNKVQDLIEKVGRNGGGLIFFPKGKYYFNKSRGNFLQINHSNIHIEGETDSNGHILTELVSCGPTSCGKKNPWLSPFFITTGEVLQPSNEFFGLQFRKRKKGFSQSNSLSDPGSDGSILTPEFCTLVTEASPKGSRLLRVADSSKIGKYIMFGLYNTTHDGNLIKEILGVEELRPEWKTALRAGEEEAPSYQWLVEVDRIIDKHTIELTRPLLRAFDMIYEPAVFNVTLLENITICNLRLNSKWNGMFRHHGFPVYYSIAKSQEMDYGWNAINLKRVAHSKVFNVEIVNFTNPIYVLDSRNVTMCGVSISGYDGHQGLKIYQHACDCLFRNITFYNHFADMLGGEGNAYGNVFSGIRYLNPSFHPVDFDFHGFGEGPMSPPSDNLFECISGFRCIKSAGALYNLPSCAQNNIWWNIITEGERKGGSLFYAMTYREKKGILRIVTAVGFAVAIIQKNRNFSPRTFVDNIRIKLKDIDRTGIDAKQHYMFFKNSYVVGINTKNDIEGFDEKIVHISHIGQFCHPVSLYGENIQDTPS
ncbi:MAG: glycosyl hydrolase family 28-related protein [Lachnospira sp.]